MESTIVGLSIKKKKEREMHEAGVDPFKRNWPMEVEGWLSGVFYSTTPFLASGTILVHSRKTLVRTRIAISRLHEA